MRREEEGFTLVELLTVVLILGVLAAIAMPSLLNHRTKAYRSAMQSDLSALVKAQLAYNSEAGTFTANLADLNAEGFRSSGAVTSHVKVTGATYKACTKHWAAAFWLVYDSATEAMTESPADCAT